MTKFSNSIVTYESWLRTELGTDVAVADLDAERAEVAVSQTAGARVMTVDQLIVSSEVDIVLNLTVPQAHSEVAMAALAIWGIAKSKRV